MCVCVCERIVSLVLRCASVCFSPGFGVLVASASAMAEGGGGGKGFSVPRGPQTPKISKKGELGSAPFETPFKGLYLYSLFFSKKNKKNWNL